MKNIIKLFLALALILTSANALKKDDIKTQMSQKIDSALVILKNKEIKKEEKAQDIMNLIDDVFDYNVMARIALGKKTWKSLSSEKKAEFVEVFENKLKNSYVDKLELYTDQKVKINDLVPYKKSRLQLQSEVVGSDESYIINYNFYKNKKLNEWFIYDVDLLGISIIQTYRKQFSGLLKEKSFDEMLELLKANNTQK
ncbi:ABC transporter substrate-binding protein [Poseidonibacter lekithochrous]|uniref:Tgt2/MlaC family protein n=1 Tax=Poseidonibacter lekithochrous TaxID=1904463 RepID=UPI000A7A0667|nr:ABC transporter substrate-binding protein [Poseidonibacter lekithochrous]QKJ22716.1 lipid asymmetry ABC transporter MlaABCDEF, periplasmic component MlaC [Poseidonibacter lekithochrous]